MARVGYVDAPAAGAPDPEGLRALYAEIASVRGEVLDLYRALANAPEALRAYLTLSRFIRDGSSLDPALRELAILATGYAFDVEYERFHHAPAARRAGVSEAQLAALPAWRTASPAVFDPLEQALLRYIDEVARTRTCAPSTLQALAVHLPPGQLVELVLTVAFYHLCAAVILPLGIEPERETP